MRFMQCSKVIAMCDLLRGAALKSLAPGSGLHGMREIERKRYEFCSLVAL